MKNTGNMKRICGAKKCLCRQSGKHRDISVFVGLVINMGSRKKQMRSDDERVSCCELCFCEMVPFECCPFRCKASFIYLEVRPRKEKSSSFMQRQLLNFLEPFLVQ